MLRGTYRFRFSFCWPLCALISYIYWLNYMLNYTTKYTVNGKCKIGKYRTEIRGTKCHLLPENARPENEKRRTITTDEPYICRCLITLGPPFTGPAVSFGDATDWCIAVAVAVNNEICRNCVRCSYCLHRSIQLAVKTQWPVCQWIWHQCHAISDLR